MAQGTVGDFLPFEPFGTDYFGLTKFGAVAGVAMLSRLFSGDDAMRLLMALGAVLTYASSAYLIRAWSGAQGWLIALVLLLIPGVAEAAFYFNDNLLAAGLFLAGLCVLVRWPKKALAGAAAGLLIGCAISVRTDLVVAAVAAVPLILWPGGWRSLLRMASLSGAAALATLVAVFSWAGVSPLAAVSVGAHAVALWSRPLDLGRQAQEFLFFTGLPVAVLLPLGLWSLLRSRDWHRLALLCSVPLAVNLVLLGTLWQARQFLVLTPFLAGIAALGVTRLALGTRKGSAALALFAGFGLLILVGPVGWRELSDGPHALIGRLAGITYWKSWQSQVRRDFDRIDALIDSAPSDRPMIVLTDGWSNDRYLHLRLIERGFSRTPVPSPCPSIGEGYALGDRLIVQLALRPTFVLHWAGLRAARLHELATPCAARFDDPMIVLLGEEIRLATQLDQRWPDAAFLGLDTGPFAAITLDPGLLAKLADHFARTATAEPTPITQEQLQSLLASRTAFSR